MYASLIRVEGLVRNSTGQGLCVEGARAEPLRIRENTGGKEAAPSLQVAVASASINHITSLGICRHDRKRPFTT